MTTVLLRLRRRPYVILGLIGLSLTITLFTAGLGQTLLPFGGSLTWQMVTGSALLTAVLYQWMLVSARNGGRAAQVRRHYAWHRWVGVATTLLFAVHAVRFGHGWTSALALAFIGVAATGLLNREVIPYRRKWLYNLWLWVHIALASALIPLIAVHIWVALTYQ